MAWTASIILRPGKLGPPEDLRAIGRKLAHEGMTSGRGGNVGIKLACYIYIPGSVDLNGVDGGGGGQRRQGLGRTTEGQTRGKEE